MTPCVTQNTLDVLAGYIICTLVSGNRRYSVEMAKKIRSSTHAFAVTGCGIANCTCIPNTVLPTTCPQMNRRCATGTSQKHRLWLSSFWGTFFREVLREKKESGFSACALVSEPYRGMKLHLVHSRSTSSVWTATFTLQQLFCHECVTAKRKGRRRLRKD